MLYLNLILSQKKGKSVTLKVDLVVSFVFLSRSFNKVILTDFSVFYVSLFNLLEFSTFE